jgi:hypothetical protein
MNNTNIPPTKIRNKIYENQNLWCNDPLIIHIIIVWSINIDPIANGCFICVKRALKIILIFMSVIVISECSLGKMLVLGIDDKIFLLSEVLKGLFLIFGLQDQYFH